MATGETFHDPNLPSPPIRRLVGPLARFLRVESASGIVLLVCTAAALALANSPAAASWGHLWHTHVEFKVGPFELAGDLGHLVVNDVLMTVFFFVVGLEIKRELVAGELRDPRKAALPVAAALGGMLVPALVYFALQRGQPGERGWGVPMATDIAFVVGVLALFGRRVPFGLKIMLLSLAIVDDIGAVVVIAVFYSTGVSWAMLGAAAAGLAAVVAVLNRLGVRSVGVYAAAGALVWLAMFRSGVHPTIAGVVLGLMTPAAAWVSEDVLRKSVAAFHARLEDAEIHQDTPELESMSFAAKESVSPLERLERHLHPWVGFVVMPLFALANAGVVVEPAALRSPVALAVAAGLFVGKPVGVLLFSSAGSRCGAAWRACRTA